MSDVSYHNSPFAPHPYEDMGDYRIEFAFRAKEGIIVTVTETDEEISSIPFFAPRQLPDRFYELNNHSYECASYPYERNYGLSTGVDSPSSLHLLLNPFGSGWLTYTDENYCHPEDIEDIPHEKLLPLSREEKCALESKMKSGEAQFFSLPQDSFVYSLYSVPDDGTSSLAGTIAICCKRFYYHQYQALYVPFGENGTARYIAFYDKEKRLAPADLGYLPLTRRGTLDVTLDDGDKFAVDFSRAVYHWGDEKKALAKTLLLPCVPDTPTPLVTPLTAKDIFEGGLSVSPR